MAEGPRGIVVAAPGTGQGKTTLMLGLIGALRDRGVRVGALKVGPDFIDPGFHRAAGARVSFNLDHWGMRPRTRSAILRAAGGGADLVLAEGMMGLFDGAGGKAGGSTADIAAETGWPVVLVIDAGPQAQSIAALAQGFARFRADVGVAGVVLMKVGSPGHRTLLADALAAAGIRVFGMIAHDPRLVLPERHLGLVQAREQALGSMLAHAASAVADGLDLDALMAAARPAAPPASVEATAIASVPPLGQRIAVADDAAFAFAYPHLLESWRAAGAEIATFAPLADQGPDRACDAAFLPGGYPELHAGRLAASAAFRAGMQAAAARGAAIYGECGGYMALGEALIDADGRAHAMLGLLPVTTSFAAPEMHIGYREIALAADTPLGPAGARFRGHEFHFARAIAEARDAPLFDVADVGGEGLRAAGLRGGSVCGSFLHLIDAG